METDVVFKQIVAEHMGIDVASLDRPLEQILFLDLPLESGEISLGGDSLDIVEVTMELEEEFDVDLPDQVVETWRTLADMLKSVEEALAVKPM